MENTQCYNCGSYQSSFYAKENGFTLIKCNTCSLIYMQNMPSDSEISESHKQGLHKGLKQLNMTGEFNEKKIPKYINILNDLYSTFNTNTHTWLDVGCGHGEFIIALNKFSKNRLDITGTEPNVKKQESARDRGLDVKYFDLESHNKKYDCISLLNVFSHLPNPPAFFKILRNLLNSNGELIIQTGDTSKFTAKEHYKPFLLPDHVSFASEEILTNILENTGFEVLSVKKYPYPLFSEKPKVTQIVKEIIKMVLPQYKSRLFQYLNYKYYKKLYENTDMYIRAKVKS